MARKAAGDSKPGVVVDRDALVKLLTRVKGATEKSATPIHACVLFRQSGSVLGISATNLFVSTSATLSVEPNGNGVIDCAPNAKDVLEATKAMPVGFVRLRQEDKHLLIEAVASKRSFKLRTLPGDEYPGLASPSLSDQGFDIVPEKFLAALGDVERAIGDDVTNPGKNSLSINVEKGAFFVATDGHRLHYSAMRGASGVVQGMTIPKAGVALIRSVCEGEPKVTVRRKGGSVFFTAGAITLSVKLIEDSFFPNWRPFIPVRKEPEVKVSAKELLDSVKAVSLMSSEGKKGVWFALEENKIILTSEDGDGKGTSRDEVDAEYIGPKSQVGMAAKYVIDALLPLGDERVEIRVTGELEPVLFTAGTYSALLMPMKFER